MKEQDLLKVWRGPSFSKGSYGKAKGAKYKGTYGYWIKSVRRLSIFTDTTLDPGELIKGHIPLDNRLEIYHVFKEFMGQYEGKKGDDRPFTEAQELELKRVLANGYLE